MIHKKEMVFWGTCESPTSICCPSSEVLQDERPSSLQRLYTTDPSVAAPTAHRHLNFISIKTWICCQSVLGTQSNNGVWLKFFAPFAMELRSKKGKTPSLAYQPTRSSLSVRSKKGRGLRNFDVFQSITFFMPSSKLLSLLPSRSRLTCRRICAAAASVTLMPSRMHSPLVAWSGLS